MVAVKKPPKTERIRSVLCNILIVIVSSLVCQHCDSSKWISFNANHEYVERHYDTEQRSRLSR